MRKLALFGLVWGLATGCPSSDDAEDDTGMSGSDSMSGTTSGSATGSATGSDSSAMSCPLDQPVDTTDGASDPLMETWGAPCSTDDDCVALLGEGAECADMAVIYELPGGYCTKPCSLPDTETTVQLDHPDCDPNGGVACVGQKPLFEQCILPCTDDQQCNRDGYYCDLMPMLGKETDPTFCLMPECCETSCSSG